LSALAERWRTLFAWLRKARSLARRRVWGSAFLCTLDGSCPVLAYVRFVTPDRAINPSRWTF